MRYIGFKEYVKEVLQSAEYKEDSALGCIVAIAPVLPGCMTQGENFEQARDNLIDAIELWITVGLRQGEKIPEINGARLVTDIEHVEKDVTNRNSSYA
jgi:predicted RNase H-like HicB family nuclease